MTKKEIFLLEERNTDKIYLYVEGQFLVAYERSAHRFTLSYKEFQKKKKFFKNLDRELVTIGFPRSALARLADIEILETSEKHMVLRAPNPYTEAEFAAWKADVPLQEPKVIRSQDRLHDLGVGVPKSKELPVFTLAYELLKYVYSTSQKLKREYKYSLGIELKNELLNVLREIQWAIFTYDEKFKHIRLAQWHLETSRVHLRMLYDLGQLPQRTHAHIVLQTGQLSLQLQAWSKAFKDNNRTRRITQETVRIDSSQELSSVPDKLTNPLAAPSTEVEELSAMGILQEKVPFPSR